MQTLLWIKQITTKDLLYSAGNAAQHSVMTYMQTESKKQWIYVYIYIYIYIYIIVNQLHLNKSLINKTSKHERMTPIFLACTAG